MPKLPATLKPFYFLAFLMPLLFTNCKQSCSKTVSCPAYNDSVLDAWFPYDTKYVSIFKSDTGFFDTIVVKLNGSSGSYQSSSGFGRPFSGCDAFKSFVSLQQDSLPVASFSIILDVRQDPYSSSTTRSVSITLHQQSFYGNGLSDLGFNTFLFGGVTGVAQNFTNYILNGRTYPIAQSFSTDSLPAGKNVIYKMTFAKNNGIIAYETRPGNVTWVKQ